MTARKLAFVVACPSLWITAAHAAPQCAPPSCTPPPATCAQNVKCTLFGAFGSDRVQGIYPLTVGGNAGNFLVCGETTSNYLDPSLPQTPTSPPHHPFQSPTAQPFDSTLNTVAGPDAFVAILNSTTTDVVYWTYLGGNGDDRAYAAVEDEQGNIWVSGWTNSMGAAQSFPHTKCLKESGWTNCNPPSGWNWNTQKSYDAFVVKLSADLSALLDGTVIGGSGSESPRGTLTVFGNPPFAYIAGSTQSAN